MAIKQKLYTVRLNDTYLFDYDPKTGYCYFDEGDPKEAYLFATADEAMRALADVVWGGSDNPPEVITVEVEIDIL